jgi:uncharacterized SAM-binding protein YcdF (DUF218 family)
LLVLSARIFSTPILAATGRCLIEDDGPRKADAIVVLGGDQYGDRALRGAELVKAGYAPFAIVSGPPGLIRYQSTDEVEFAEQHGYPASIFREIHLPPGAESTRMEAQFVGKYLQEQGIHNILLVTSNFHTKRAAKIWRQVWPKLAIAVVPSVDPEHYFTPETWWKTRSGQKIFLYESMKTVSVMLGV